MSSLREKKCVPCEGGAMPLPREQAEKLLTELSEGWEIVQDGMAIEKGFQLKDFAGALAFVNKVGEIAESEDHHPDILIHGWNKVRIMLSTHAIGGLSENDFIVAAKIDGVEQG